MSELDPLLQEAEQRTQEVTLPSGVKVTVRELSILEFAAYGEAVGAASKGATEAARMDALARLLAATIVKPDGTPKYTLEQAKKIAGTARVAQPIVAAIMEVSGYGPDAKKD